ncbi:MAG: hypothetical protein M0Z43_08850 [Acidithiobacillus sp.]|nr:hypothetical protein [Acidithiobacillus sp.]
MKVTLENGKAIQHIILDPQTLPVEVFPSSYHASPFGGFRIAADFLCQDNVHLYPGASTAYDPEKYGYEADAGGKGTISHIANHSALRLALADGTNGAKSRLRTHDHVRYQAGAATHVKMTIYSDAGTLYSVIRSSITGTVQETLIEQSAWSEVPSTIDVTKGNIYEIMYQWLGVGEVMYFVNGVLRNIVQNAGQFTAPYMKTANLPMSFEIVNDGSLQKIRFGQFDDNDGVFFEIRRSAGAGQFTNICSSARILNGMEYPTISFGYSRALTAVGATMVPLFSLRIKELFNGIPSRIQLLPTLFCLFAETREGGFALVENPTLTGATFVATSPSPAVEIDTAASAMSGGVELFRAGMGANTTEHFDLENIFTVAGSKIRKHAFSGVSDILTVGVMREGNQDFNPRATLNWREVR